MGPWLGEVMARAMAEGPFLRLGDLNHSVDEGVVTATRTKGTEEESGVSLAPEAVKGACTARWSRQGQEDAWLCFPVNSFLTL